MYGLRQYLVMLERSSVIVTNYIEDGAALEDTADGISKSYNLTIAFAVAKFGYTEKSSDEYADYGSVKAYYDTWNESDS